MKVVCPSCKKFSEIINGNCSECNYNIYDYMYKNGFAEGNSLVFDKVYICPECGKIDAGKTSISLVCENCGINLKPIQFSREEYWKDYSSFDRESFLEQYVGDTINWDIYHQKRKVQRSYFEELENAEKELQAFKQQQKREQEKLITRCPKCNGTSFTPVRKKFSLLAGFATNKIELVCNNCGTVVKPK